MLVMEKIEQENGDMSLRDLTCKYIIPTLADEQVATIIE